MSLREKCPNMEFFSGPYLNTFHAVCTARTQVTATAKGNNQ